MRLALLVICITLPAYSQEPKKVSPVPSDRRADAYAIYSAVLSHPALSHIDNNQKYLIDEVTGYPVDADFQSCIAVPERFRASFAELLADRQSLLSERFRLERALKIPKPYELLTAEQVKRFHALRFNPGHSTSEEPLFAGAVDVITLGMLYFNKNRTLAAVYTWASCGSLCGYGAWRMFLKNAEGDWEEQQWTLCMTVAASREPVSMRIAE